MRKDVRFEVRLFIYAAAFAVMLVVPTFLPGMLSESMTWGDGLDFLTPWLVVPAAWWAWAALRREEGTAAFSPGWSAGLMAAGSILFINGHGIHLSANASARLLVNGEAGVFYRTVYLFDEIISHHMWDGGVWLISLALMVGGVGLIGMKGKRNDFLLLGMGAAMHGFTFAVNGIEGQTLPFTLPAAALTAVAAGIVFFRGKGSPAFRRVALFVGLAYVISLLLFIIWGLVQKGFPQFSELGWI